MRRGREVAAPRPAREAHEVPGAAAVAGAEAARPARRAGQRRQRAGELAPASRPSTSQARARRVAGKR